MQLKVIFPSSSCPMCKSLLIFQDISKVSSCDFHLVMKMPSYLAGSNFPSYILGVLLQ